MGTLKKSLAYETKNVWKKLEDVDKIKEFEEIFGNTYVNPEEKYFLISDYSNFKEDEEESYVLYTILKEDRDFAYNKPEDLYELVEDDKLKSENFRYIQIKIKIYKVNFDNVRFLYNFETKVTVNEYNSLIDYLDFYNISKNLFNFRDKIISQAENIINN